MWEHENGSPIQIFNFHSLEHLTLQAALPPAKRRAANHISPQPTFSQELPQPPVFCIFQEEPTRQCGVYASQAARPQPGAERSRFQMQGQERVTHQLPFPSLLQEALRRVTNIRQETHTLLHIIQNNPLAGNSYAHQCGVRACHEICTEMETLEDALEQIP